MRTRPYLRTLIYHAQGNGITVPGVLIDNVRRQLPFDAAADDGGAAGGTDGALSDPTDAQASPTPRRSPWAVSDDHETGEAATLQAADWTTVTTNG